MSKGNIVIREIKKDDNAQIEQIIKACFHEFDIPLTGTAYEDIETTQMPICKITNCIFVNNKTLKQPAKECIRCNTCNTVCPIGLLPQQLYWHAKSENIEKCTDYHLSDCIECACCSYVCPSNIDLVSYFSFAKALDKKQSNQ